MRLSISSFFLCAVLLVYVGSIFYPRWQKTESEAQISWDAGGYYWYLPSAFIYKDLKGLAFKDSIMERYRPSPPENFQYGYKHKSGHYVLRYTIGIALMEAPFFAIAHIVAEPLGFPADGFSKPYQFMIYCGGLLFSLIGLWYLRKLLLFYYSDRTVALALILLVFGTNYLNYAGIDVGMTHCWLFTLYVFILLNTHYYYQTFHRKYALRLGLLIGMTALIRPTEIISVIIPLLWALESVSIKALRARMRLWQIQKNNILGAVVIAALILSTQFIYWKYVTGDWFVYTYQDQGFSWFNPHLKKYALNYQCGWLMYTPMMLIALIGLIPFAWNGRNRIAIIGIILINYYIVASWDAWDYGGRAMIQSYPILMFPLASFLEFVQKKGIRLLIATPVLILFSYFNLWWTYQAHEGGLIGSVPATAQYYFATALRYNLPLEIQKLRDNPDLFRKPIRNPVLLFDSNAGAGQKKKHAIEIQGAKQQSFHINRPQRTGKWLRASADIRIEQKEWNVWFMTQFIIRLKKGDTVLQENSIRVQRLIDGGTTRHITVDAQVRHMEFDSIEILFRNDNEGQFPCWISNVGLISFND